MKGLFITFEGGEGCGKSTQAALLCEKLQAQGHQDVLMLREPGGTPVGEEIRHTLKHSRVNAALTPETELLLMNASRAQLVREVIRPALASGRIVVCDRFYDSTIAYQGYGRGLDLAIVRRMIEFTVGETRPALTLLLDVPPRIADARLHQRQSDKPPVRDRIEEAGRSFFERVAKGYAAIAAEEPDRVRIIDGSDSTETVAEAVWKIVRPLVR